MKAKLMLSFSTIAFFAFSAAKMLAGGNQPLLPKLGTDGAGTKGVQPLKYSAKELDRENGLDLYDSKARWYDSMIGRTPTQDPLAEKYYDMSPYLWCAANPITLTDPTGMYFNSADSTQAAIYMEWLNQRIKFVNKSDAKDRACGARPPGSCPGARPSSPVRCTGAGRGSPLLPPALRPEPGHPAPGG